jgi:GAF domain-containing protein
MHRPVPSRNVKELETALLEAEKQQAAMREILRVISSSPADVQPVLEAVAAHAARICDASDARIFLPDGEDLRYSTGMGDLPVKTEVFPLNRGTTVGRAIIDRSPVHIQDILAETAVGWTLAREVALRAGWRTALAVPFIREDRTLGAIVLRRRQVRPFTEKQIVLLKTFADQAAIAIENVRLFNETKEALEQQTASSEILRLISSSPSNIQPVFDAVLERALALCDASHGSLYRMEGAGLRRVAARGMGGTSPLGSMIPLDSGPGRAVREQRTIHLEDVQRELDWHAPEVAEGIRRQGIRTILAAPLMRERSAIGAILIRRTEVRPFSDKQIRLFETFADQAVIAIENVRLFNETKEALERQTATAEILKVIASSPSDVQPVFDAIATSANRLIGGITASVTRIVDDMLHLAAFVTTGRSGDEAHKSTYPRPLSLGITGKAARTGKSAYVSDYEIDPEIPSDLREVARKRGFRSMLSVPMIREGVVSGAISVSRREPGAFTDHQIGLLQTFADQAVIAIENVRLFNETREALERQTATSEILKVISNSPTDTQPVFEAIVQSAARLFHPRTAGIVLREGDKLVLGGKGLAGPLAAKTNIDKLRSLFPLPYDPERFVAARAIAECRVIELSDAQDPAAPAMAAEIARTIGYRSLTIVPLVRDGTGFGLIVLSHPEPGFKLAPKQLDLVKTFADQAVIAIENVRLFKELEARNKDLGESLEQQTATSEILRVISGSPTDVQPVLDVVAERAAQLCDASDVAIFNVDGNDMHVVAHFGSIPFTSAGAVRKVSLGTAAGHAVIDRRTVHVHDIVEAHGRGEYPDGPALQRSIGYRTVLVAPLLREGAAIGAIVIRRMEVRPFSAEQVKLLETFADQAVIAIENVRLFNETKESLEQQTATAEILKAISSSPTDVQPVFEAIVRSGVRLFRDAAVAVARPDGDKFRLMAIAEHNPALAAKWAAAFPFPVERAYMHGAAVLDRTMIEMDDALLEDGRFPAGRRNFAATGYRAMTVVPMMKDGAAIGTVSVVRVAPGPLTDKQKALLRTFADQAVIAIENVRLFNETKEALDQQSATAEILRVISTSMADTRPVFEKILQSCKHLFGSDEMDVLLVDDQGQLQIAAYIGKVHDEVAATFPAQVELTPAGRAIRERRVVHYPDVINGADVPNVVRRVSRIAGYQSMAFAPMLWEDRGIGAIGVARASGAFTDKELAILQTFADQAVIAIQNARLFREIAEKSKQLEVASRHKSEFLASMSHELRTPLNAILGFNEMLLGEVYGDVPADMQAPLSQIQSSGKHLLRLINNVLDLAKIEAGRMELSLTQYLVEDAVESVRSTLEPLAAEKRLEFVATVSPDVPSVFGDPGRIIQCLINLAGNSLKFTKAGRVEIQVEAKGGLVVFKVTDTGIGIPPDKIGSLFTEFKQTDATIASEYGGTGLGLSITRKFIEMHGGRIWVESELGKGSAFIFEVPLRVSGGVQA